MMSADHDTHSPGLAAKSRVSQNSADEQCRFFGRSVEPDQPVGRMAEPTLEEMLVAREKCGLLQPMQQGDDIVIPDTQRSDVLSDHPAVNAPRPQDIALVQRDVFIQKIHAA